MKYLYCVGVPVSIQLFITFIIIAANTGNGSWAGLGAFLFAIMVVPLTAIITAVKARAVPGPITMKLFGQCLVIGFALPVAIAVLYIAGLLLEAML